MNEVKDVADAERPTEGYKGPCLIPRCREDAHWKPIMTVKPIGWRFLLRGGSKRGWLSFAKEGALCDTHMHTPPDQLVTEADRNAILAVTKDLEVPRPDFTTLKIKIVRMVKR